MAAVCTGALLAATGAVAAHASAATRNIYVANVRGNSVSVVDPATNTVIATVPVGAFPVGAAVSPDGTQAWTANQGSNNVSVISTSTNTVTATIPVGRLPFGLTFAPDGKHAYVGHLVTPGVGGVAVVDTSTDTVVADINVGNEPESLAVTPDGSHLYTANFVGASVSVIDTATNTVTATISGSGIRTPTSVAIAPDGAHAYVSDFNSGNVFVIDTATNAVTAAIPAGAGPGGISVTPDGAHVYVADENGNMVSVIDTATNTVTATIPVGSVPDAVVVDGIMAYASNGGSNNVSVIDTTTNTVTATVPVGSVPFDLAEAPPSPLVTGISPVHGPEAGGTTVTLTGIHLSGTSQVLFGATPATGVTVINDFTVTATAPAHADGVVDVTATTPAGTSLTSAADQYTYDEPAPVVTALSPSQGPLAGGTSVTITGTDFLGATAVSFGSVAASSFTVNSDTQITAVAPASSAVGPVDVTVTTPAGTSATGPADRFSYVYQFTGFQSPVDNPPTLNQVNGGQSIPIKFSLGGNFGLNVIASGFPTVQQVSCTTGAPVNPSTLTDTAGGSGLQFDPSTQTYTYVWKTLKSYAGTCQVFTLGLNDGSLHVADFQFMH